MNKKYCCALCNYSTDRLSSLNNHNKSKKHLVQINNHDTISLQSHKIQ